ncbi:MAG: hypothetical protein RL060_1190 [Bacteroidota bacterium]
MISVANILEIFKNEQLNISGLGFRGFIALFVILRTKLLIIIDISFGNPFSSRTNAHKFFYRFRIVLG